jgi:1-deoxy-D-xylulose-5-phosphate reductoisomerase
MRAARNKGVDILPIDSEHSAIMQCLEGEKREHIRNLIITCSGGALRDMSIDELKDVTAERALKHPQWAMGAKITIDSATLVNKGFEVIEARWLFDIEPKNIKVVIHPQSIVHSMVEFTDGSVKAQLGNADMHTPISYALLYPQRAAKAVENFSILDYPTLTFAEPDRVKYPALDIAYECLERGGTAACVMNGSNEVAVAAFLKGKCGYLDIVGAIRYALDNATFVAKPTLDDYTASNLEARMLAEHYLRL